MKWTIRQEKGGDEAAIANVTRAAFEGKSYADGTETDLAGKLRDGGALVLSLVATEGKVIIGHVALSPAKVGDTKCLCLGPLAVRPDRQGRGIGSALVNHAVAVGGIYGRGGVVLIGDPTFYARLGFAPAVEATYIGKSSQQLQINGFDDAPVGDVQFHAAFEG
jgi:putative acetyltransferase